MPPEADWWWDASRRDLEMARHLSQGGYHEGAAFHAQQAAEKAFKALLAKLGIERRTHSATHLLGDLEQAGYDVAPVASAARDLDRNYIGARYPNGFGGAPSDFYDGLIAERAITQAEQIRAHIEPHIA